jgi:hypothetical protein
MARARHSRPEHMAHVRESRPEHMANVSQSRPDSDFGFQTKVLENIQVFPLRMEAVGVNCAILASTHLHHSSIFTPEVANGSEESSYSRRIDFCITQL